MNIFALAPTIFGIVKSLFLGGGFTSGITDIFKKLVDGKISKEQAEVELKKLQTTTWGEIEKQAIEKTAEIFKEAHTTLRETFNSDSWYIRMMLPFIVYSQGFVLFYYQFFVPLMTALGIVSNYPSPGDTISWAYALLGGVIGLNVIDRIKAKFL